MPASQPASNLPAVQDENAPVNFADQTTWILGYFNPDKLTHYPYSTFYTKGFDEYMPGSESINNLMDIKKDNLKIKVVMGTWCPDSRREVPRFMKVMEMWQFPLSEMYFHRGRQCETFTRRRIYQSRYSKSPHIHCL